MGLEKSCEIVQIEKQFPYFQRVCQPGMVSGGDGTQCAAQISRDIMLEFAAGYGVAKDFSADLHHSVGNPCRFGFKRLADGQQVLRFNTCYGLSPREGNRYFSRLNTSLRR